MLEYISNLLTFKHELDCIDYSELAEELRKDCNLKLLHVHSKKLLEQPTNEWMSTIAAL